MADEIPPFDRSVFVNCPFDLEYLPLFRPLIFAIHSLGFIPRFALERSDSGETRIGKIMELISHSRWGVHDLCRCIAKKKGEYYRMNMPLELGLDMGSKAFGGDRFARKRFLILEKERYRFQQAISDISSSDIKAHRDEPEEIVRIVRDWLVQEAGAKPFSPTLIWARFNEFMGVNFDELKAEHYSDQDIDRLPEQELSSRMAKWLHKNPLRAI